jgi:hypothetical protein
MHDTPPHIQKKQLEILMNRPDSERLRSLLDLTDFSRSIILDQLRENHAEWGERELAAELFRTMYRDFFDRDSLERISGLIQEWSGPVKLDT